MTEGRTFGEIPLFITAENDSESCSTVFSTDRVGIVFMLSSLIRLLFPFLIYGGFQIMIYRTVRVGGTKDSFHHFVCPYNIRLCRSCLEREAQIPPIWMNQMRNIPIFSGHFTVFHHPPKAEQISLPLEATSAKPNVVGTHEVVEGVFCSPTRTVR